MKDDINQNNSAIVPSSGGKAAKGRKRKDVEDSIKNPESQQQAATGVGADLQAIEAATIAGVDQTVDEMSGYLADIIQSTPGRVLFQTNERLKEYQGSPEFFRNAVTGYFPSSRATEAASD